MNVSTGSLQCKLHKYVDPWSECSNDWLPDFVDLRFKNAQGLAPSWYNLFVYMRKSCATG